MIRLGTGAVAVWVAALWVLAPLSGCGGTMENLRLGSAQATGPATGQGRPITVMSYNIRLGLGQAEPKGKIHQMPWGRALKAVIAAIRAADPDIAGLQEVAGPGQMREIARALNMNYAFQWHETGSTRPRWWGVGVLSKFPIAAERGVEISFGRGNARRAVLATLDVGGRRLMAVSVHKDKDLTDGASIARLLDAVRDASAPVLLIGDFNIKPEDRRLDAVKRRFADTALGPETASAREARTRGTFHSSKNRRIDYIFAEKGRFRVLDAGLGAPAHRLASDHIAYVARVALTGD